VELSSASASSIYSWFSPQPLGKLMLNAQQIIDLIAHMHGNANCSTLIGDGAA
jgi:hypothetical protein